MMSCSMVSQGHGGRSAGACHAGVHAVVARRMKGRNVAGASPADGMKGGRLRGRLVAGLLALMLACTGLAAWTAQPAQSEPGAMRVTSYIVRPGDTLWLYASRITPAGQDVSQTVDRLMALNGLESSSLRAGQRIVVPAE
nr:LysM peptidoglycan-binding domain-containing protein [Bifidobacterium sp. SO4]